jgi:hypothetical protein
VTQPAYDTVVVGSINLVPTSHATTAFMELDMSALLARIATLPAEGVAVSMFAWRRITLFDDAGVAGPVGNKSATQICTYIEAAKANQAVRDRSEAPALSSARICHRRHPSREQPDMFRLFASILASIFIPRSWVRFPQGPSASCRSEPGQVRGIL